MKWKISSVLVLSVALLVCLGEKYFGLVSGIQVVALAIKTLYGMTKSDFDAFYKSYDVFDQPQLNEEDEAKVNSYYKILMPLLELGGLSKFYIPPLMDASKESFRHIQLQQELFEQKMADTLSLGPGKVALDIGCGQGLIADVVQQHTGAKVVGINISPEQLEKAQKNAERKGKLGTLLEFKMASMNDDPFPYPDKSFDAVYSVQTTTYAHNLTNVMREVRRVLKPGGKVSIIDGALLENYDPENKTHVQMAQRAKRVGGIPIWRSIQEYENAYLSNGFSLTISKHLSHGNLMQSAADFFQPLGDVMKFLQRVGLISKPLLDSLDRINEYGLDLIRGDRDLLFTTDYWIVAQG